uniref:NADH dehydrogenase subunit 6 n=1 Tax=Ornithodoros coriaceus TaxID=92741 RepID=A0A3G2KJX8_ORNCO|nr:NADH dehydrogenase subunit 6 [Ornithodoros coriaceus]AYN59508.1 NADH dehydrogenase subunit 6 [Ornithodoros coriaceus]
MKLMLFISLAFISMPHPISMLIIMIMMTVYINILMYMMMKHTWFILIITLLMLGGLLVIFMYITSLTPNKKFYLKKYFFVSIPIFYMMKMNNLSWLSLNNTQTMKVLSSPSILIFMLIYLMITLMAIMSLIKSSLAPLKAN